MSIIIDQQSFDSVDLEFDITPTSESVPVVVTTTLSRRLGPRARQTLLSPVPWGGVPGPSYILRSGGQAIRPELWVIYDEHGVQTSEGRDATDVASLCREDWQKIRDPVVARLHPKWAPELTRSLGHLSSMSFGRPPSLSSTGFTATPPDRGSFPLDHYGAHLLSKLRDSGTKRGAICRRVQGVHGQVPRLPQDERKYVYTMQGSRQGLP